MSENTTDVKEEVLQDAPTDSSTEENTEFSDKDFEEGFKEEFGDTDSDSKEETADDSTDNTDDDTTDSKDTGETDTPPDEPKTEKAQNRFQELANRNRELQEQLQRLQSQDHLSDYENRLLGEVNPETGEFYTAEQASSIAKIAANEEAKQARAQESFKAQVEINQNNIATEAQQVLDNPLFNPESKEYVKEVADNFDNLLAQNIVYMTRDGQQATLAQLTQAGVDPRTATLVGSNVSPLQLANTLSTTYNSAANRERTVGQAKAQRATEKMLANVDDTGSSSAKSDKSDDPFSAGFREEMGF